MQKTASINRPFAFLLLITTLFFFQCGCDKPKKDGTRPIDRTTADNAINAYLNHNKKLMIKTLDNPSGEVLRGYVINMDNMEKLLSKKPDQLFLEFAVFPDSLNSPVDNQYFSLVISGYKNGKILRDNNTDLLYEYLRPCPPNGDCP